MGGNYPPTCKGIEIWNWGVVFFQFISIASRMAQIDIFNLNKKNHSILKHRALLFCYLLHNHQPCCRFFYGPFGFFESSSWGFFVDFNKLSGEFCLLTEALAFGSGDILPLKHRIRDAATLEVWGWSWSFFWVMKHHVQWLMVYVPWLGIITWNVLFDHSEIILMWKSCVEMFNDISWFSIPPTFPGSRT